MVGRGEAALPCFKFKFPILLLTFTFAATKNQHGRYGVPTSLSIISSSSGSTKFNVFLISAFSSRSRAFSSRSLNNSPNVSNDTCRLLLLSFFAFMYLRIPPGTSGAQYNYFNHGPGSYQVTLVENSFL
jgi:hypothetical protein